MPLAASAALLSQVTCPRLVACPAITGNGGGQAEGTRGTDPPADREPAAESHGDRTGLPQQGSGRAIPFRETHPATESEARSSASFRRRRPYRWSCSRGRCRSPRCRIRCRTDAPVISPGSTAACSVKSRDWVAAAQNARRRDDRARPEVRRCHHMVSGWQLQQIVTGCIGCGREALERTWAGRFPILCDPGREDRHDDSGGNRTHRAAQRPRRHDLQSAKVQGVNQTVAHARDHHVRLQRE